MLLAGALAVPVLAASPAAAADNVICVLPASTGCSQSVATIPLAIAAAGSNGLDNTILLGATTYSNAGNLSLDGFTHSLTLRGAGQASTFLTMPSSASAETYVTASTATVADLTITMTGGAQSAVDTGLYLSDSSIADHVTVNAATAESAIGIEVGGSTITHSVVQAPADNAAAVRGIYSSGSNTVSDTTISGAPAFDLSDPNTTDVLSRVSLRSDGFAVLTDGGNITIDDAVIDLGAGDSAVGLASNNANGSTAGRVITANHVTIVGGGVASRGVWAYAASPNGLQTSVVNLTNSIVRGPATSLVADAGNDGAQGGPSNATLNVSYSDFQTKGGTIGANGTGGVVEGLGNLTDVDPGFVSGSDRHLTVGSAVVDKGNPAAGGPTTDLDGNPRVQDGDLNGSAVRDMGAYELSDITPPDTMIDSGPAGPTSDSTPTFTFSSTEAGSSFICVVDGGAESGCSSPLTTSALADGPHTLAVTATDSSGNSDATPATRAWSVDTVAPDTAITSGPTGLTSDATPTFTFTSEVGATFECKVDTAAYAACTSPLTTNVLPDGAHTLSVRAQDAATNVDLSPATRAFTVDATAPDTTVSSGPTGPTNDATPTFAFGSEPGATFQCKLDGAAYAACTSPVTTALLADGAHTFSVRATDAASNTDASPATRTFTVDTAAPDVTITKKPAKRVTKQKVKIVFTGEAGASYACSVDGKAYAPCTSPLKLKVKVGKHIVLIRATDAAGNVGTPAKVKFKRIRKS